MSISSSFQKPEYFMVSLTPSDNSNEASKMPKPLLLLNGVWSPSYDRELQSDELYKRMPFFLVFLVLESLST